VPLRWDFRLRQQPTDLCYKFEKVDPATGTGFPVDPFGMANIKVSRHNRPRPAHQVTLELKLEDTGFAKVRFETSQSDVGTIVHQAKPIDLHDLSHLEGTLFFGLDLGTYSTLCSFVNIEDSTPLPALPDSYRVDPTVARRAALLEEEARELLQHVSPAAQIMHEINDEIIKDYVYHSNRIEGSQLGRGQTHEVLEAVTENPTSPPAEVVTYFRQEISYVDDSGEIHTVLRPIRDKVAAVNLRDAFRLVEGWSLDREFKITGFFLRQLQSLVTKGDENSQPGQYRQKNLRITQTSFVPPDYSQVESLVNGMFDRINSVDFKKLPALLQATEVHARFVSIHPFVDGNGRTARLLTNYFLWAKGLPGILLPWENRDRYYDSLEECNASEVRYRGDLSDLSELFCDLFEDAIAELKSKLQAVASSISSTVVIPEPPEDTIVEEFPDNDTRMGQLLARIVDKTFSLSSEEQYVNWKTDFESLLSDIRKTMDKLSRAFNDSWGGGVNLREYNIIDVDTYQAIRKKQRFSRTWYFKVRFSLPTSAEELVFFFSSNSAQARALDSELAYTASLHIARYDKDQARFVPVSAERWSRVNEIVHSGSRLGILFRRTPTAMMEMSYGVETQTDNWFAMLVEDVLTQLGGVSLTRTNPE